MALNPPRDKHEGRGPNLLHDRELQAPEKARDDGQNPAPDQALHFLLIAASGDVLLDTSIVIPYFRGEPGLRALFLNAGLFLPQIVLGELYCGANLSVDPSKQHALIARFLSAVVVLSPGLHTSEHYGRLRAALSRAGTPIPENDIWIAALAIEHQLPLAARDSHFAKVSGLITLHW
jgi:tRNA(fMet)-specific endonuclease VapC